VWKKQRTRPPRKRPPLNRNVPTDPQRTQSLSSIALSHERSLSESSESGQSAKTEGLMSSLSSSTIESPAPASTYSSSTASSILDEDVCVSAPEKAKKYRQLIIEKHPGSQVRYHDLLKKCVGNVPLWIPDETSERCMFCQRKFTIIERRHHCRKCGALVCGNCAEYRLLLSAIVSKKPVRVCVFCYVKFYDDSQQERRRRQLKGDTEGMDDALDDELIISSQSGDQDSGEPLPEDRNERMRLLTIKEIVDTEKQYVEDLHVLSDVFMFPIQMSGSLTNDQIQKLFSCLDSFGPVHEDLLKKFEEDKKQGRSINIGERFLSICEYLKMYTMYCSNHDAAIDLLRDLKKNAEFMRTLNICLGDPRVRSQDLGSFIIKPVQRICKYPLFFRELLKYTPADHPDRPSIEKAAKMIEETVKAINEGKRKIESQAKIVQMLETIDYDWPEGELVTPSRIYMSEVEIKVEDSKGKLQDVVLVLFNDLALITNHVSGKRKPRTVIGYIPMDDLKVSYIPDSETQKNRFEVRRTKCPEGSKLQAFMFHACDEFEMFKVVEDITHLQEESKKTTESREKAITQTI